MGQTSAETRRNIKNVTRFMRSGVLYYGLMKKNQYERDASYVNTLLRLTVYPLSRDLTFTSY